MVDYIKYFFSSNITKIIKIKLIIITESFLLINFSDYFITNNKPELYLYFLIKQLIFFVTLHLSLNSKTISFHFFLKSRSILLIKNSVPIIYRIFFKTLNLKTASSFIINMLLNKSQEVYRIGLACINSIINIWCDKNAPLEIFKSFFMLILGSEIKRNYVYSTIKGRLFSIINLIKINYTSKEVSSKNSVIFQKI